MRTTNIIAKSNFILTPPLRQRRRRFSRSRLRRRPRVINRSRTQSPRPVPTHGESGDYADSRASKECDEGVMNLAYHESLSDKILYLTSSDSNESVKDKDHVMGMELWSGQSGSSVKERSFSHDQTSVEEQDNSRNQETPTSKVTSQPTDPEMSIR